MEKVYRLSMTLLFVFLSTLNFAYAEYKLEKTEGEGNISFLEKIFKKFNFCSSVSKEYDEWRKKQVLVCKGKPIYSENLSENYCKRIPEKYVKVNLLGENDNLLIDIDSYCVPHANNNGFFLLLENNNCYILPRAGETVEFLGKIINTNDKKEALLVRGRVIFQGEISDYIQKCSIRENKYVCKDIIYAQDDEFMEIAGGGNPISVSLDKINLDNNYLNVKGKIIEVKKKYPFEARFDFNQETGEFLLKEIITNKQLISVLSKEKFPANDYLKNNPELKVVLDEIIKKYKIPLKESVVNKINILYENKQYTIISFQYKDGGTYATISFPNDAKNPKFYKLYSGDTTIFSGEKKLPNAVKTALLFFYNVDLEGKEVSDDVKRIKCFGK